MEWVDQVEPTSFLESTTMPWFRRKIDYNWNRNERKWLMKLDFGNLAPTSVHISTSFRSDRREHRSVEIVDTRTTDLEFSSDSSLLAVGSGSIHAGYISVIKTSSFQRGSLLINPIYKTRYNSSVLYNYPVRRITLFNMLYDA